MIPLSRLGLGGGPLGNLYAEVSEEDALGAVEAAWAAGVRYFDTSPHYGLGLSERRLGAALTGRPRSEFVLSTKVGRVLEPASGTGVDTGFAVPSTHRRVWDFSADGVRRSLESSLERLGVDRVDVLYLHDVDLVEDPVERERAFAEGWPALVELRARGVVRAVGVGVNDWRVAERFVREADPDVVMLAGRYTLLEQGALASFLPACAERGVAVVAAGVFNSGVLARQVVPDDAKYHYADAPPDVLARARAIAEVCRRHGATLPQAAIRFPLGHPAVVGVVVGARSAEEVAQNAAALAAPLPAALWADLRDAGLLDAAAPVP
ncbi:aldo/keto reductase [Saccharothrix coeruleofusca]|uniref:Oxidoreductase n=1 Tax=Saccharothrix coeruleofusca TaxID=33919 RepID=A0A918AM18_9PSEU|nr:aldo/keto reductase [Saccharothrix coeruleofusca]GGP55009.1 oxidoreductase [Saccharothrix coeruleofusca]